MKKLGYREMLRDRCPKLVSYALKWQKAKEKWIDHTYEKFVKIVGDEYSFSDRLIRKAPENKKVIMRALLGIVNGKVRHFDFDKTIDWDNLTDEEKVYWKRISSWVKWFSTDYAYIESAYDNSKKVGRDEEEIKIEIINSYLAWLMPKEGDTDEVKQAKYQYIDNFVNYLFRCFEGKN